MRIRFGGLAVWMLGAGVSSLGADNAPLISRGLSQPVGVSGPIRLRLILPADRRPRAEPLLSVGQGGAGEIVFIYYQAADRVSLGWERAGGEVALSEPQSVPADGACEVLVSLGSLMPANESFYAQKPELKPLRKAIVLELNGRRILTAQDELHPTSPGWRVTVGANEVGGSMAGTLFSGRIEKVTFAEPAEALASGFQPAPDYPGPLHIRLRFPRAPVGQGEPLVVTGVTGAGDIVYVRYDDQHHFRIGFDHWNKGGPVSRRIEFDPGTAHELVLTMGSLLPLPLPGGADIYAPLRGRCVILFDDQLVLECASEFYPSTPAHIATGANPIGGSTAGPAFTGQILNVEPVNELKWMALTQPRVP